MSKEWGKTRYTYAPGLRLRVDLAPDEALPSRPSVAWLSIGERALRFEITVVDRAETPWGSTEGLDGGADQ